MMCSNANGITHEKLTVSPMSGSPTFDIGKKKQKRGQFETSPSLRAVGVKSCVLVGINNECYILLRF